MLVKTADYVVAGGGLCGCVVASRLQEAGFSVILIESGPDASTNPAVLGATGAFTMAFTNPDLLHQYSTVGHQATDGRPVGLQAGHLLGGGSAVNYAAWTRGHRADYDSWARLVGDPRWSYDELLPYFKRSESYCDRSVPDQHGYDGPIKVCSGPRGYPLEQLVREALLSTGLKLNPDMNSGDPNGVAPLIESWQNGTRQFAAKEYDLKGVKILSNSHVAKLVLESGSAKGVELVNGEKILAKKEVILSSGAVRTPQILMLSGIGPKAELYKHGIPLTSELPVGKNLHDHGALHLNFKVKNPEKGYLFGSAGFNDPKFLEGSPIDFLVSAPAPDAELRKAAEIDGVQFTPGPRSDYELACAYGPAPAIPGMEPVPMDGSFCGWPVCCLSTTSRGSVTLTDTNPESHPAIQPAYFATEHDRAVMRAGVRAVLEMVESPAGRTFIAGERPPNPSFAPLTSTSSDAELDARVKAFSGSYYHLAGTAAMGSVTDTRCRVKGVGGLRVIDASILPISIGAHLQAPLYGIAERAVDMMINGK